MCRFAALLAILTGLAAPLAAAPEAVPFEVRDHRVFVPVQLGEETLDIFLDTGMPIAGILLFRESHAALLEGQEILDVMIPGAGAGDPSPGVMADGLTLRMGGRELTGQRVVVSFGEPTQGFRGDGVIGASLFEDFAVELDYAAMLMTLHERESFHPGEDWTRLPVELRKGIPWVKARLAEGEGELEDLSVYIDFADGTPLTLLTGPDSRFAAPDSLPVVYLGTGMSGDIHGRRGRVDRLVLGPHVLRGVSTDYAPAAQRSRQYGGEGILGCGLLERFHLVFDYAGGALYLKPNEGFADPFE